MESNQSSPAPQHRLDGQLRAFVCHETYLNVHGFCFAKSAGQARMIAARSAWDAGYPAKITTIKVRRQPAFDGRVPADYRNRLFSMEYAQHLPLPNSALDRPERPNTGNADQAGWGKP
jgi:hypothetical protein